MGLSNVSSGGRPGICTSTTRPSAPFEGQMIYETDTNRVLVWDNAAWVMIADTDSPPGIELLEAGTFTTASSKSISKFSSTYKFYQLWVDVTAKSANGLLYVRLRSGSTDAANNDYYGFAKGDAPSLSSTDNYAGSGVSYYPVMGMYTTTHENARIDIYSPFETVRTNFTHQAYGFTTSGGNIVYYGGCQHNSATSYDGITILPASGTFTGSYALYGFRNAI